ncbi:ABC transporter ATP-binding protein [Pseudooceanicola sp. CBS1P-1]|uniref:ATP-binding cassette domain-containing protein n=1 Tax=Pseudooceanicola albus TaxID=2692189 RepID=A0A6L7FY53_9RHOB|nr:MULTISPECIES: ABC transporter ATP-binding protein [Pseudooceanicola]MBT9383432.1 ABC transporter ATP-binding protein [Pseudooceanicola endophyticus]MXN16246.1 ATP-binding cassette domain-containing protein [Pseudooceanicola albus]
MSLLSCRNLAVTLRDRVIFEEVSLDLAPGELVGLIGPNGAGKTTLMRAILGLLPHGGSSSLAALSPGARALKAAWMPQARDIAWPVRVEDLVALGRLPHRARPAQDHAAIEAALDRMGLQRLRHRRATRLSGGEQARVLLARALAQEAPVLLADEPIAGLDPEHQIATMTALRMLADEGRGVILSLHDLGLAARHCTRLILLAEGQLLADGPPEEVLSPGLVARAFRITAYRADTPNGPVFQPLTTL